MSSAHRPNTKRPSAPAREDGSAPEQAPGEDRPGPEDAAPETESAPGPAGRREEESVESDLAALTDRLLRLKADYDNYRKRVQRDQAESYRRALEAMMGDLLPVLDHFEMGLRNAISWGAPDSMVQGFALVHEQLKTALAKNGLEAADDAGGSEFDPQIHESVSARPSDQPRDRVLEEIRRGYRLGGRLLRPAQVIVSLGPVPADGPDGAGS